MDIWEELGIDPTRELKEIKAAYGERLKGCHPEDEPEAFQRLYTAFQAACRYARSKASPNAAVWTRPDAPAGAEREEEPEPEESVDFQALIARGLREKTERRIRAVLAQLELLLGCGARNVELQLIWEDYLRSPDFQAVMYDSEMLDALCRFLRAHSRLSARVYMAFYSVYEFTDDPKCGEDPLCGELYHLLQPWMDKLNAARSARVLDAEWKAQQRKEERERAEAHRRAKAEARGQAAAEARRKAEAEACRTADLARREYRVRTWVSRAYLLVLILGGLDVLLRGIVPSAAVAGGHYLLGAFLLRAPVCRPGQEGRPRAWRAPCGICLAAFLCGLIWAVRLRPLGVESTTALLLALPFLLHGVTLFKVVGRRTLCRGGQRNL